MSCSTKRLRRGRELSVFDFLPSVSVAQDVYVPSLVSVKADEEWLCSPSVANVIDIFYSLFVYCRLFYA